MNTLSAQKILDLLNQTQKFIKKNKEITQIKEKEKIAELAAMAGENYQENFLDNYEKFVSLLQNEEIFFSNTNHGQEIATIVGMETLIPTGENLECLGKLINENAALFLKKIPVSNHFSSKKISLTQFTELIAHLKNMLPTEDNSLKLSVPISEGEFIDHTFDSIIFTYAEKDELIKQKKLLASFLQNEKELTLFSTKNAQKKNPLQKKHLLSISPCKKIPMAPYEIAPSANINLLKFIDKEKKDFNYEKLGEKSRDALQLMDNLIDVLPYPLPQVMENALNERKIAINIVNLMESFEQVIPKITFKDVIDLTEKLLGYLFEELFRKSREMAIFRGSFPCITNSFFAKEKIEIRNSSFLHISLENLGIFSVEEQIELASVVEKNSNSSHLFLKLKENEIEQIDEILKKIGDSDLQTISLQKI